MRIYKGLGQLRDPILGAFLTIGNFDGVHIGHRQLLGRIVGQAGPSVVYTFDPHPASVLRPNTAFSKIFDWSDQLDQLSQIGVDVVVIEPFSEAFAAISAQQFFSQWIVKWLSPQKIVVGHDFCFGRDRKGDADFLRENCAGLNIELETVTAFRQQNDIVSSSLIRKKIEGGDVSRVTQLLGRNFYLVGTVEHGAGRGKTIGFPTANIRTGEGLRPSSGVYAGWLKYDGYSRPAVANLGVNPTFVDSGPVRLEVHIINENSSINLYDKEVKFEFCKKLRDEKKFANVESLVVQIKEDIELASEALD